MSAETSKPKRVIARENVPNLITAGRAYTVIAVCPETESPSGWDRMFKIEGNSGGARFYFASRFAETAPTCASVLQRLVDHNIQQDHPMWHDWWEDALLALAAARDGWEAHRDGSYAKAWRLIERQFGPRPDVGEIEPDWPIDGFEIQRALMFAAGVLKDPPAPKPQAGPTAAQPPRDGADAVEAIARALAFYDDPDAEADHWRGFEREAEIAVEVLEAAGFAVVRARQYPADVLPAPAPPPALLTWSEPREADGKESLYDHVVAASPFGEWQIEWKSWKPYPTFTVHLPYGEAGNLAIENSLDAAKAAAEKILRDDLAALLGEAGLALVEGRRG
jgi:hypothetical protein